MQHKAICQEKWVNLCVCILMWRGSYGDTVQWVFFCFVLFCFASGNNSGSKDTNGRKEFPAATRSERGCSTWAFAPTQLVWVEGLISWPHPLVPDQRWFCASQHQCLRSNSSDRNWCCCCSCRGCSAVLQYQANGKNRDTQDYCAMDL